MMSTIANTTNHSTLPVTVTSLPVDEWSGPEPVPPIAQAVIVLMYSTVIVLSVGGNSLVIFCVLSSRRMRTVTNYFLLNLACADMLMAVLCVPFTFVANVLIFYWPFGSGLCPLVTYVQAVAVFLSAFTLVGISLDRFRAVAFPLKPRISARATSLIIAHIWVFSMAVPLPVAIRSQVVNVTGRDGQEWQRCEELWTDEGHRYVFSMVIMVAQYFLPLLVLIFTYFSIGYIIWVKKMPGEAENKRDQRFAASKRKMVKMVVTVVVIYALCWLPLHSITLIGDAHPDIWTFENIQTVWICCHWIAMSNCCYNPIVYCWMNSNFRNGFRHVLRCGPCTTSRRSTPLLQPRDGVSANYSAMNQRGQTVLSYSGSPNVKPRQTIIELDCYAGDRKIGADVSAIASTRNRIRVIRYESERKSTMET